MVKNNKRKSSKNHRKGKQCGGSFKRRGAIKKDATRRKGATSEIYTGPLKKLNNPNPPINKNNIYSVPYKKSAKSKQSAQSEQSFSGLPPPLPLSRRKKSITRSSRRNSSSRNSLSRRRSSRRNGNNPEKQIYAEPKFGNGSDKIMHAKQIIRNLISPPQNKKFELIDNKIKNVDEIQNRLYYYIYIIKSIFEQSSADICKKLPSNSYCIGTIYYVESGNLVMAKLIYKQDEHNVWDVYYNSTNGLKPLSELQQLPHKKN